MKSGRRQCRHIEFTAIIGTESKQILELIRTKINAQTSVLSKFSVSFTLRSNGNNYYDEV